MTTLGSPEEEKQRRNASPGLAAPTPLSPSGRVLNHDPNKAQPASPSSLSQPPQPSSSPWVAEEWESKYKNLARVMREVRSNGERYSQDGLDLRGTKSEFHEQVVTEHLHYWEELRSAAKPEWDQIGSEIDEAENGVRDLREVSPELQVTIYEHTSGIEDNAEVAEAANNYRWALRVKAKEVYEGAQKSGDWKAYEDLLENDALAEKVFQRAATPDDIARMNSSEAIARGIAMQKDLDSGQGIGLDVEEAKGRFRNVPDTYFTSPIEPKKSSETIAERMNRHQAVVSINNQVLDRAYDASIRALEIQKALEAQLEFLRQESQQAAQREHKPGSGVKGSSQPVPGDVSSTADASTVKSDPQRIRVRPRDVLTRHGRKSLRLVIAAWRLDRARKRLDALKTMREDVPEGRMPDTGLVNDADSQTGVPEGLDRRIGKAQRRVNQARRRVVKRWDALHERPNAWDVSRRGRARKLGELLFTPFQRSQEQSRHREGRHREADTKSQGNTVQHPDSTPSGQTPEGQATSYATFRTVVPGTEATSTRQGQDAAGGRPVVQATPGQGQATPASGPSPSLGI